MRVRDVLEAKGHRIETVDGNHSVAALARRLSELQIGALLVTDSGDGHTVAGIVSERDIIHAIARHGARALLLKANEIMTSELVVCDPDDALADIMAVMTEQRIRHLPVVAERRLIGIISIGDVVKHRLSETADETEALRSYLYSMR